MCCGTFGAIFQQTHLITLTAKVYNFFYCKFSDEISSGKYYMCQCIFVKLTLALRVQQEAPWIYFEGWVGVVGCFRVC
jgi:hypothetical protein